jgi:quercetin dioxygenase-like cupin family protein
MHTITRFDPEKLLVPAGYEAHSRGYTRQSMLDHTIPGCVHHSIGICQLEPGGYIQGHLHSFEEGFYILEGEVILTLGEGSFFLSQGDFGFVPTGMAHGWRNVGHQPARWHETLSPQSRPLDHPEPDTFFLSEYVVAETAVPPDFGDPRLRYLGHFDDAQLPPPSEIQMDGVRTGSIHGIQLKMLVDKLLGCNHFTSFMVQFQPGGAGTIHDHPFEETYFFLSGEAKGILDGQEYHVKAGDLVWSSVGGTHGYFPLNDQPVCWLETQAPQPPSQHAFRFNAHWRYLQEKLSGDE